MRRPQMKPCQGRYNITAAIKAGSYHITSVGAQGHPHGRVFISTEEPSSALAAVSRWSMHSPRADGREVPQPSQVHVAMGSRLQRGSSGLGTAASPLHQTSSPPPVRNCLWLQHGERQRQSCNPPAPVPTTDRAWANIPAPSPPVGSDSAAGLSRTGTAPAVAIHVTPTGTAADLCFSQDLSFSSKSYCESMQHSPPLSLCTDYKASLIG